MKPAQKHFGFHSGQRLQVLPLEPPDVALPPLYDANLVVLIDASFSMFVGGNPSAWDADMDGIDGTAHDIVGATLAEFLLDVQGWCRANRYTLNLILIPYEVEPMLGTTEPETAVARGVALGGTAASVLLPAVVSAADWFISVAAASADRNRVVLLSDGRTLTRTWVTLTPGGNTEVVPNAVESADLGKWEYYGSANQPTTTNRDNLMQFRDSIADLSGNDGLSVAYNATGLNFFILNAIGGVFDLSTLAPPEVIANGVAIEVSYRVGRFGAIYGMPDFKLYSAPDPVLEFAPNEAFFLIGNQTLPDSAPNILNTGTVSATTRPGHRYLHLRFYMLAGQVVTDVRVALNSPASVPVQVAGLLSPFAATLHPRYAGHPARATPEALATLEAVNTGIVRAADRRFLMVAPSDRPLSLNPADIFGPGNTTARRTLQLEDGTVLTLENGEPLELEF